MWRKLRIKILNCELQVTQSQLPGVRLSHPASTSSHPGPQAEGACGQTGGLFPPSACLHPAQPSGSCVILEQSPGSWDGTGRKVTEASSAFPGSSRRASPARSTERRPPTGACPTVHGTTPSTRMQSLMSAGEALVPTGDLSGSSPGERRSAVQALRARHPAHHCSPPLPRLPRSPRWETADPFQ